MLAGERENIDPALTEEVEGVSDDPEKGSQIFEEELIIYEEALSRAGGFGAYQSLTLFICAILYNYGSQLVFAFGYLTNATRLACR